MSVSLTNGTAACCLGLASGLLAACGELPGTTTPPPGWSAGFTEVTGEAGLADFRHETGAFGQSWMPETFSSGGGFFDVDGDGWEDILLVGGGVWPGHGKAPRPALELYRNRHDGTFERITESAGLGNVQAYGFGIAAADVDNDGDPDLFLTTLETNLFFRNDGGTFVEAGTEVGLADHAAWGTAALFFDADRDGWVDLYVGNYVPWTPETDKFCTSDGSTKDYCTPHQYDGSPGRFYRNDGDGTYTEWTEEAGLGKSPGKTLGLAELDFDRDGWSDFVVTNDTQRNLLYRNRQDGSFEEIGVQSGIAFDRNGRARAGMGVQVGVVDRSGEPTVFVGNFTDEMVGVFRHMGNGVFVDRAPASGVGMSSVLTLTFGVLLLDVEFDGDLDLLLANGHIVEHIERMQDAVSYRQAPQLFLNDGEGIFKAEPATPGSVLARPLVGRAAAYADYDRDGDLDVLITENGGPVHLWRNDLDPKGRSDAHFLRIRLEGRRSNRDALGARVTVMAGGGTQERRVHAGGSYLSQSELAVTFGLGSATAVDTLHVAWPSGREDVFTRVEADREVLLVEDRNGPATLNETKE